MWITSRGVGKMLTFDELVYSDKGPISIGDLSIGDEIFDESGNLTKVTAKQNFYDQEVYEITFSDGSVVKAGQHHEWLVYKPSKKTKASILETQEMARSYLGNVIKSNSKSKSTRRDRKYFVKIPQPVQHSHKDVPVDPYYLGLWLGDGCAYRTSITSADCEILDYATNYSKKLGLKTAIKSYRDRNCKDVFTTAPKRRQVNTLRAALDAYGLVKKAASDAGYQKYIPKDYLYNSEEIRMELLKGLLDTDGSCDKSGHIEFSTSYANLRDDFAYLLGSLGIRYTLSSRVPWYNKNGQRIYGKTSYRFLLSTERVVFKLPRKIEMQKQTRSPSGKSYTEYISISKIVNLGVLPGACIEVDNASHLFLTTGFIPTHNSYLSANAIILHEWLFSGQDTGEDGVVRYDPSKKSTSVQVVGASSSQYSEPLMSKVKDAYEFLPGSITLNGITYPSPLYSKMSGSWKSGASVIQKSKKKIGRK